MVQTSTQPGEPVGKWHAANVLSLVSLVSMVACSGPAPLPDDGFIDATGGRIAYRVMGDGSGVPVLVIHGGPGSSSCIYPSTLTGIAAERPVIMYDQLGTGHSDRITDLAKTTIQVKRPSPRGLAQKVGLK